MPIPRQEIIEPMDRMLGDAGQHIGTLDKDHRLRGDKIRWKRFRRRCHTATESYSRATAKQKPSSDRRRPPRLLWVPPINSRQQITKLCRRDRHHAVSRTGPQKTAPLQALGEQACALAVVPDHLHKVAATSPKAEQMTAQRIATGQLFCRFSGRCARAVATKDGTTGSFWRRCIILRSTTSPGAPFRWSSAIGIRSGNGSGG